MNNKFLDLLPPEIKKTAENLYDLILERAISRAYQNLNEETKGLMTDIFNSGTDEEKEKFLEVYLGEIKQLMIEEAKKVMEEIKKE